MLLFQTENRFRTGCRSLALLALAAAFTASALSAQRDERTAADPLLLDRAELNFPTLGVTVTVEKRIDPNTGEAYPVATDAAGRLVDISALRSAEIAARLQPEHKLEADLLEAFSASPGRTQRVALWLNMPLAPLERLVNATMPSAEDLEALNRDEVRAAEARTTDLVVAHVAAFHQRHRSALAEIAGPFHYVSTTAPVVFATVDPSQARALAQLSVVERIYLERDDAKDHDDSGHASQRFNRVHQLGVKGSGVSVAFLENNGIDPACPHLNVSAWFNAGTPNPDTHIHGTSGVVASQLASRIGAAPEIELLSANAATYGDSNVMAAADWAVGRDADITNMSYGGQYQGAERMMDRYYDYQVRISLDSFVASAGNDGLTANVGSPGTAYNVVTVGGYFDRNGADWGDQRMYNSSSALNPTSGCEKPNLVGMAEDVDTIGAAAQNWLRDGYNGTSFSAPYVSGGLANAMSLDTTLITSPPAATAAAMVTAWNNVEGNRRLSGQDGAGAMSAIALMRLARDGNAGSATLSATSFNNNGYYTRDIFLQGGDITRVAICWNANADSSFSSRSLDADLDLGIYTGQGMTSGTSLGFSSSFNNNFEIVRFIPPTTGWYTIRINDYRFDGTSERVGWAWSQKYADSAYARIRNADYEGPSTAGASLAPTLTDHRMQIRAEGSPNALFLVAPSSTYGDGFFLPGGTFSPLSVFDPWYDAYVMNTLPIWSGMNGTLNSNGFSSTPVIDIGPWSFLEGFRLNHVALTIDNSFPDGVKDVSEVYSFVFREERQPLTLTDDDTERLRLGFSFPFYGQTYSEVWVNSNGNLTFGAGDTSTVETVPQLHAGAPRVAVLWDDLEPDEQGTESQYGIGYRLAGIGERHITIEYINIGEYQSAAGAQGSNTAKVTLWSNGRIDLEYDDCTLNDGIIGIGPGNGLSSSSSIDFTSNGYELGSTNEALFEQFISGSFDLDGLGQGFSRVSFVPTTRTATRYRIEVDTMNP